MVVVVVVVVVVVGREPRGAEGHPVVNHHEHGTQSSTTFAIEAEALADPTGLRLSTSEMSDRA